MLTISKLTGVNKNVEMRCCLAYTYSIVVSYKKVVGSEEDGIIAEMNF